MLIVLDIYNSKNKKIKFKWIIGWPEQTVHEWIGLKKLSKPNHTKPIKFDWVEF